MLPRSCTLRRGPATPARCAWRRKGLETGPPADPPPHFAPAARARRPFPRRQRPRHQSRRGSGLHVWLAPSRRSAPTSAIPARSITRPACEVFSASRSSRGSNTDSLSGAPRQSNDSTLTACARSPEKRRHSRVVCHAAQFRDAKRVLLGLVESAVRPQLRFDLVVPGQRLCLGGAQPARRLALGESEVLDTVLGHDARCRRSDARAHSGLPIALAAHGCDLIIA